MRYVGGKSRSAKYIAEQVRAHRRSGQTRYVEPFLGGGEDA